MEPACVDMVLKERCKTGQEMYVSLNIEERSRYIRCRGEAVSFKYSARAPAPVTWHTMRMCSKLWPTMFFPHYLVNDTIFGKDILNTKCVFWFSLQVWSVAFFILRKIQRDVVTNVHRSSCTVPINIFRFDENLYFNEFSTKSSNNNFQENPSTVAQSFRAGGGTDV